MTDYTQILTEQHDAVLLITYNRPDRLNAWTRTMGRELHDAITAANADDSIGAIVVTGAGRGFCAGADMAAEFQSGLDAREQAQNSSTDPELTNSEPTNPEEIDPRAAEPEQGKAAAAPSESNGSNWVELVRQSKPMVAAVNGPAIGMGLSMILPFDFIVAGRSARLSARFIKVGVVPELASTAFLPRRVGFGMASDLMLSARIVDAEEARAIGLVDLLVDDEQLVEVALRRAEGYAENAPPHLFWVKDLLTQNTCEADLAVVQERELAALQAAYRTSEHREAVQAFLEKRPARFR